MTFSEKQLAERRKYLGASEAAAVLGLSPFQTASDVWHSKMCDADPEPPSEAMKAGIRLEPVIVAWAAERLGVEIETNIPTVLHRDGLPMAATPDAMVVGRSESMEAKRTSLMEDWGDEGTDEIPKHYLIQAHHQIRVLGVDKVWVPVLMLAGYSEKWRLYCVNADEELEQRIEEMEMKWWDDHIVAESPPDDAPPAMEILKRLRRQPKSSIVLGHNGIEAWAGLQAVKLLAKEQDRTVEEHKAAILSLLGVLDPVESASLPDGTEITYFSQNSGPAVDTKRLRAEWPEAFEACVSQGEHRVLRLRKAK